MYKFYTVFPFRVNSNALTKLLLRMKLTFILLLTVFTQTFAGYSQQVSFKKDKASMREVINEIQNQTGYNFIVSSELLKESVPLSVTFKNEPLRQALDVCFANQPFVYVINKKTIVVSRKPMQANSVLRLTGKVTDEKEDPLPGAPVRVKTRKRSTITHAHGRYR